MRVKVLPFTPGARPLRAPASSTAEAPLATVQISPTARGELATFLRHLALALLWRLRRGEPHMVKFTIRTLDAILCDGVAREAGIRDPLPSAAYSRDERI